MVHWFAMNDSLFAFLACMYGIFCGVVKCVCVCVCVCDIEGSPSVRGQCLCDACSVG